MNIYDYINNNIPLTGCMGRKFYPKKPRSCKDCHFMDYDKFTFKRKGCRNSFKTSITDNIQKPLEKCYPVKDEGYGYASTDHADCVAVKILQIKEVGIENIKYKT